MRSKTKFVLSRVELAIIKNKPYLIIPLLFTGKISIVAKNKLKFYRWFSHMIKCAKINSTGSLIPKYEQFTWQGRGEEYLCSYYDEVHEYSRLNLLIQVSNNRVKLDVLPF